MSSSLHSMAQTGFNTGSIDAYNRGRPSYPQTSLEHVNSIISAHLMKSPTESQPVFLELGAGTGKFTSSFLRYQSDAAAEWFQRENYIATEPSKGFRRSLAEAETDIRVMEAVADSIPAGVDTIDAIICAQCFHWFASEASLAEIHRVLRRDRPLVMIFNSLDTSIDWQYEIEHRILQQYYHDSIPRYITNKWLDCFSSSVGQEAFEPLNHWSSTFTVMNNLQEVIDRVLSVSVIASLPQSERDKVEEEVRVLLRTCASTKDMYHTEDCFQMQYISDVYHTTSKGPIS